MWEKAKNYLIGALMLISGLLFFLFKRQSVKVQDAESELAKSIYKAKNAESEVKYENTKQLADSLANDYIKSRDGK